jgi:DNA processing protein
VSGGERSARAALSVAAEPAVPRLAAAVTERGAADVVAAIRRGDRELDPSGAIARRLAGVDGSAVLAAGEACGARFLIPHDAAWPAELAGLPHVEHAGQGGEPLGLWLRGPADLGEVLARRVAVVGSRAATDYGVTVAGDLAAGLAERGVAVVSGAAYGIDAAAHRSALSAGGVTVAVLACGVDLAYPRGNAVLVGRILEHGLVVSELPPGAVVSRPRLLARNRLVAALGGAVVVVEAAVRSGALSTAGWADDLGLPVLGVPGPVTSSLSSGVHRLLRQGALLVADAADVVDAVGVLGDDALPLTAGPARVTDGLPAPAQLVLEALPVRQAASVEALCRATGAPVDTVLLGIATLHGRGLVEPAGGGWRVIPPPRGAGA